MLRRITWIAVGVAIGASLMASVFVVRRVVLNRTKVANVVPPPVEAEEAFLYRTYGPTKYSQSVEEWIVRDFFRDKRDGTFLDVGAADYADGSNTWFLENKLHWSGVAIDAQEQYRRGYEEHRPRSRFFAVFVSDHSNERVRLFLSAMSPFVASKDQRFTDQFGRNTGVVEVSTITLDDLLSSLHVNGIDFMSMDIELSEPEALAGFDIERYRPALVCVEAHRQVRQQILDYFAAHEYVVAGKYLRVDPLNLWFVPVGTNLEPFPLKTAATEH